MAVLLLFLSIIFVYYVYFSSNDDKITSIKNMIEDKSNKNTGKNVSGAIVGKNNNTKSSGQKESNKESDSQKETKEKGKEEIITGSLMEDEKEFLKDMEETNSTGNEEKEIEVLSGTKLWSGNIQLLGRLNINYQNILSGKHESYFVKIDDEFKNIKEEVEKIGGNTVEIFDKKNIIENSLTGDKVMFINLPKYKEELVNMVIQVDDKKWFIQVDYDKYYRFKDYLKNILYN